MSDKHLPQHIEHVSEERVAIAPYNFVPLPEKVVPAEEVVEEHRVRTHQRRNGKLEEVEFPYALRQDRYYQENEGRYTGSIACTLTTATPLYVRCGLTLEQFQQSEKEKRDKERDVRDLQKEPTDFRDLAKNTPDFFYTWSKDSPVIPGSSLRGMLRTLVEIVSYSKIAKVSKTSGCFFRAVAAKGDDPLARPYRDLLKNVRAGYLVRMDRDKWAIQPARTLNGETFIKVRERDIPSSVDLIKMNDLKLYQPQYLEVSFTTRVTRNGRTVVDRVDLPGVYAEKGWLVTSGNMIETGKERARTPRKNHSIVLLPNEGTPLLIEQQAIEDYRTSLTEFQRSHPFHKQNGLLGVRLPENHPVPVFYCEPQRGQKIIFFGHSPNFRIPYRPKGTDHARTPVDFLPKNLQDITVPDLTEAIFGFVRDNNQLADIEQVRAGRVFVSDAIFQSDQGNPWLDESGAAIVPPVLGSPKPTTFQHYLVQTSNQKRELKHYASTPENETVLRGHKLYWHQEAVDREKIEDTEFLQKSEKEQMNDTQHTQFKPVKPDTKFEFTIRFENLSEVELGALLWVLRIAADKNYRLKLGMGKPLGMGAVQITSTVHLSDRVTRYATLFDDDNWATGESTMSEQKQEECITTFEAYVLHHSGEKTNQLKDTLRMQCLLALLKWPGPLPDTTRYMQIEHGVRKENEYKDRPVLPSPLQVAGIPMPGSSSTSQQSSAATSPKATSANQQPPINVPAIGTIITGNRSGPIRETGVRGVKVVINAKWYQVPPGIMVIGVIRTEDAGGQVSGGFRGEVTGRDDEDQIIYLFLKPVKSDKKS